jgi:hypothetical protein
VKDIKTDAPVDGDWLQNMFIRQYELEIKYRGPIEGKLNGFFPQFQANDFPLDIDRHDTQAFIKDAMERIIEELMEAANTLKNKPWKQTQVITDQDHFDEELMDAWHFFLRLLLIRFGPDDAAEATYKLYFKKSEVNKFRQESNY